MAANLLKKIPKTLQIITNINNAPKLHQRSFSSLHKKSDDYRYASLFAVNPNTQIRRASVNLAQLSTAGGADNHTRVNSHGANKSGVLNRFPPSSVGERNASTRELCSYNPPLMEPRGKVAVVTGATRGIGLAITEELLCNGAKVLMIDVGKELGDCTSTRLASIYGWDKVHFAAGDVTCFESFEACVHLAACKFQRLDILVNNAGVLTAWPRDKIIDINYKSMIFGTHLGFKYMGTDQGKDGGIVVNVASIVGLMGLPGSPVYSATKHAIIGATMSYGDCLTFDKTCVRVCAVCPGATKTDMTTTVLDLPIEHFREGTGERTLLDDSLKSLPNQASMKLGPATVHIIRHGENGSIWVAEGSELYQVIIPEYHSVECCDSRIKNLQ